MAFYLLLYKIFIKNGAKTNSTFFYISRSLGPAGDVLFRGCVNNLVITCSAGNDKKRSKWLSSITIIIKLLSSSS